jgi:hypothetical protein
MAVVTVGVALIDWLAESTSIAAALALNYFHTEPFHVARPIATSGIITNLLGLGSAPRPPSGALRCVRSVPVTRSPRTATDADARRRSPCGSGLVDGDATPANDLTRVARVEACCRRVS